MTPSASQGLPKKRRLARSSDFARLREAGQRLSSGCLVLNWMPSASLRLGVVTSRRVGPSVARSRARRLLREAFRRHQQVIRTPVDMVLVARPSIAGMSYDVVERDYLRALERARLREAAPKP